MTAIPCSRSLTVKKRTVSILCVLVSMSTSVALAADVKPATNKAASAKPASAKAATAKAAPKRKAAPAGKTVVAKRLPPPAALPLAQIVDRNIAARGGLTAWRALNSVTMSGELEAGGKENPTLPFVLSMKRPHRSRLELTFAGETAAQVWDGTQGWKVRPYLNRNEVEPYTAAETRSAAASEELDGPLVDFEKKGTKIELAGTDVVEGRNTYKLRLTLKGGERRNLWIDASTFLEAKIDGEPRRMDGRMHHVAVFYRDFRPVGGLQFPHAMETVVDGVKGSHRMTIKAIKLNPPLDDGRFTRPQLVSGKLAAR